MRGQAAFELMILVGFLIIIATGFISIFHSQFSIVGSREQRSINNICNEVAEKINAAYYYGVGFSQNVTLPEKIGDSNYTINVTTNKMIICKVGNLVQIRNLLTNNTNNTTSRPPFVIIRRKIIITNEENTIVVS